MPVEFLEGAIFKKIKPPEKTSMQKIVIKLSGNIIENEREANIVLFIIAIIFFATSAFFIWRSFYSGDPYLDSEEWKEHVRTSH